MDNNDQSQLRRLLVDYFSGDHAHVGFDQAVSNLELSDVGVAPEGVPHTIWEQVEHIRISQFDILEFSRNPRYESPPWPKGYWPSSQRPSNQEEWEASVRAVQADRRAMLDLVEDPGRDLLEPFGHGSGQTLFREAMLIVDHNAYHIGQIVQIRRQLGIW